jgi:hypothetical protein
MQRYRCRARQHNDDNTVGDFQLLEQLNGVMNMTRWRRLLLNRLVLAPAAIELLV